MSNNGDSTGMATIDQVIAEARRVLDPRAHAWAAAGAGSGATTRRNRDAVNRLALVPHVGRDVRGVDISTSLLAVPMALPVFLAPVAALELYDAGEALSAAQAASAASTTFFCSTHSKSPWAEVAETSPGRHFFQLYVFGDDGWVDEVVARAEGAGFGALCVTMDIAVVPRRDHVLETGAVWRNEGETTVNLADLPIDDSFRTAFSWKDLQRLCGRTELPVLVKGIMNPQDAMKALDCGAKGIYVSNHGGRSVDHAISSIEVLGEIIEAVDGQAEVAVDGGFTRGAEICKALALGARAVGIGRLQCWALAAGGSAGMKRVLDILTAEISSTMANIGCSNLEELTPQHVRW